MIFLSFIKTKTGLCKANRDTTCDQRYWSAMSPSSLQFIFHPHVYNAFLVCVEFVCPCMADC